MVSAEAFLLIGLSGDTKVSGPAKNLLIWARLASKAKAGHAVDRFIVSKLATSYRQSESVNAALLA